jgi:hypothetical protein
MRAMVLFYVFASLSTLTLLLPLWESRRRWAGLSTGQRLFTGYLALEFSLSVWAFVLGRLGRPNLWLSHLFVPVETLLIVLAFSAWQVDRRMWLALSRGAPFMLLFWLPKLFGWEPLDDFSIGSDSLQGIICLAVAAYTVVRRSFDNQGFGVERDWFWIGIGVMLYFATYALISPLSGYLVKQAPLTAFAVLTVRAGFQVVANVLYYCGMRCQPSRQSFGPSMSPRQPWPPFSWSRSERR